MNQSETKLNKVNRCGSRRIGVQSAYVHSHLGGFTFIAVHQYASMRVYARLCASMHIYLHLSASICIYLHLSESICTCLHLSASTCIYLHLCISRCIYVHLCASKAPVRMCVAMSMYTCTIVKSSQQIWLLLLSIPMFDSLG